MKYWAWVLLALVGGGSVIVVLPLIDGYRHQRWLAQSVEEIIPTRDTERIDCTLVARNNPIVLVLAGQSNAANHGELIQDGRRITVVSGGKCSYAEEPLPGGTGHGGSIAARLPSALAALGVARSVVIVPIAVNATAINDWTVSGSPLRAHLEREISALRELGMMPDYILWQQGEADSFANTAGGVYREHLVRLVEILNTMKVDAPVIISKSTVCRSEANRVLRSEVDRIVAASRRTRLGPDFDALLPSMRSDGCHFSAEGLNVAAKLWAVVIAKEIQETSGR